MRIFRRISLLLASLLVLVGCGGATIDDPTTAGPTTTGGEEGAGTADGGTGSAALDPATDPAAASLDEPPPAAPTAPATLVAEEGLPPEGTVREEPRPDGGVRLVLVLPVAADGSAVFEMQTTPGRSGDIASFSVRARHPQARWTACVSLALEIDGRVTALPEGRVLAGPANESGALETALATIELREAKKILRATAWRILACDEPLVPAPATRPTLARFFARVDELARGAAAAPANPRR